MSLKVFRTDDEQEFLDKEFRVENGDVSRSTDQRVGRRRKSVMDVVADERHSIVGHQRTENVVYHFLVNSACRYTTTVVSSCKLTLYFFYKILWLLFIPRTVGSLTAARHISMRAE